MERVEYQDITSRSRRQIWTLDQIGNWDIGQLDLRGDNDFIEPGNTTIIAGMIKATNSLPTMTDALDRTYSNAPKDWCCQWVFPPESRWKKAKTSEEGRHHVHESIIRKGVKGAVRRPAWPNELPAIRSVTFSRHNSWKAATTFGPCRNFSSIGM